LEVSISDVLERVDQGSFWVNYLRETVMANPSVGIHLGIFAEPFLSSMLNGDKTIESRFSRNRCAPYGEIQQGDVILIKEVAGPICGLTMASKTWCFDLSRESIWRIRERFGMQICADDDFWLSRSDSQYATIIELAETTSISPLECDKRDRHGWVSLRPPQMMLAY
jgi:hypothetical protein